MRVIKINPMLKIITLILQFIIILTIDEFEKLVLLLFITLIFGLLLKLQVKLVLKYLQFGIFLSLFTLLFHFLVSTGWKLAILAAVNLMVIYLIMIIASLTYKKYTTNKEVAYVINSFLKVFKIFGYNQNKMYTVILVVLNQMSTLKASALRIYKHARFKDPVTGKITKIKQIIQLLPVFMNNTLKLNENFTIGLLNKGYTINNKQVDVYLISKPSVMHTLLLTVYIISELLVVIMFK